MKCHIHERGNPACLPCHGVLDPPEPAIRQSPMYAPGPPQPHPAWLPILRLELLLLLRVRIERLHAADVDARAIRRSRTHGAP